VQDGAPASGGSCCSGTTQVGDDVLPIETPPNEG